METYKKIRSGYLVRYIDSNNKWWKLEMNGKFKPSKSMLIDKDYGYISLNIVDEGIFGLRAI